MRIREPWPSGVVPVIANPLLDKYASSAMDSDRLFPSGSCSCSVTLMVLVVSSLIVMATLESALETDATFQPSAWCFSHRCAVNLDDDLILHHRDPCHRAAFLCAASASAFL